MAEQRMRELGREGGVAWLAERLRRGDLERSMVELAAYCGCSEAREAFDSYEFRWCSYGCGANDCDAGCCHCAEDVLAEDEDGNPEHPPEHWVGKPYCGHCGGGWDPDRDADQLWDGWPPFDKWLRGLERWPGALLRAAIAAARATLPVACCGETHPECKRSCQQEAEVIDAAERWLNDPTEENRKAWADLWEFVHPWAHLPTAPDLGSYNGVVEGDIGAAAELIGEQRVREAICGRLREWAIG